MGVQFYGIHLFSIYICHDVVLCLNGINASAKIAAFVFKCRVVLS